MAVETEDRSLRDKIEELGRIIEAQSRLLESIREMAEAGLAEAEDIAELSRRHRIDVQGWQKSVQEWREVAGQIWEGAAAEWQQLPQSSVSGV